MAAFKEYDAFDAVGLAALVRRREVSALEVFDAMAARLGAVNPRLNAVVWTDLDRARAKAARGLPDGPFAGVPNFVKDLHAPVLGMPLTHASRLFMDNDPGFDAETVARLRRAGFILAGRTNAPEFGMGVTTEPALHGPCRNPWSLAHSTGGSSGGAAAAVAGGIVPAAHATDSLGSIRIPASCCGLVGLKPTRGLVPVGPHRGDASQGLSHEHCVTRTVRDSAAILDATAGPDLGAPWFTPPPATPYAEEVGRDPGRLRIGLVTESWTGVPVHPDCVAAVEEAGRACASLGHAVEPLYVAVDGTALGRACQTILMTGLANLVRTREAALGRPAREDELEPATRAVVERAGSVPAVALHAALADMNREVRRVAAQLQPFDVVMTPTLAQPPARLGTLAGQGADLSALTSKVAAYAPFTGLFSATGQPAMSLPLWRSAEGLPVGVQAVARFGADATLFRLAAQLEPRFVGRPAPGLAA